MVLRKSIAANSHEGKFQFRLRQNTFSCPAAATNRPAGTAIQIASAMLLAAIARASNRPNGTGIRPSGRRASQLRVKLGTIRPPIRPTSVTTSAMPARVDTSARP